MALTVTFVARLEPKETPVSPARLVPVTVTTVPPPVMPEEGEMALTLGVPR